MAGNDRYFLGVPEDTGLRVSDRILQTVCFLFVPYQEDGREKQKYIGTGFFVGVTGESKTRYMYLVTAKHVIEKARERYGVEHVWVRVNTASGGSIPIKVVTPWTFSEVADVATVMFREPLGAPRSAVQYSTAKKFSIPALTKALIDGRCHLRPSMAPSLLIRVRQGLLDSPFTVHAIRDYCEPRFK